MAISDKGGVLQSEASQVGLSLLFAVGKRPTADDIERLVSSPDLDGAATFVSHRPVQDSEGWLELLSTGLTFDLQGLEPASAAPLPPGKHRFGLAASLDLSDNEAIALLPGPHISSRKAMLPVVQAMAALAASIALPLGAEAVCWHSARSWIEPQYFSRMVHSWLAGGAFPALGLTAIERQEDGSLASLGLDYFVGQEVQLEPRDGEAPGDTAKLAVRVIDYLVRNGRLEAARELEGSDGERLLAEPSQSGRTVWVWRER